MGGGVPDPTPTATPAPGGETFVLDDDCDPDPADNGWTEVFESTSTMLDVGAGCGTDFDNDNDVVGYAQGPLDTTDEYCSFLVQGIINNGTKIGCNFRAPMDGAPGLGVHYKAWFNNQNTGYGFEITNNAQDYVDGANTGHCGCSGADIADGDYAGIHLQGITTSTQIDFWLDISTEGGWDPQDWTTWPATPSCSCSYAELTDTGVIDPASQLINAAGSCGPTSTGVTGRNNQFTSFVCGDVQ
jgi:hypothetical protein